MTAPLFLLDAAVLAGAVPGGPLDLTGPEGRHAATVARVRPGEAVLVADGAGRLAAAVVQQVRRDGLLLRVERVELVPERAPRFVLVQALVKGGRDEQAVEQATELGVDEVVAWQAERSVVVWRADRAERSRRRWEQTVRAAAKQSRRARVPLVDGPATGAEVAARVRRAALGLVLHETASLPLGEVALPAAGEVVLVVGPEGGVTPGELEALIDAGGQPVRLGPEVLRSSTAGPAALAVLSSAARWR